MTLQSLRLDDLTWEDLRALAQQRIPAASGGRWTHHAPVDAGVTLLELFAFLLESQVFVLDQVSDGMLRAILTLLGEQPRPAGIARTVIRALPDTVAPARRIGRATVLRPTAPDLQHIEFTVFADVALLPLKLRDDGEPSAPRLLVNGADRTAELEMGRIVPLAATSAARLAIDMQFDLAAPMAPGMPGAPLSFLLDLATPASVPPAWAADAVNVPPPAELGFAVVDAAGHEHIVPPAAVSDGTGGLRRSGLIRIPWQSAWVGQSTIHLHIAAHEATFSAAPRLRRIVANAFEARHSVDREIIGRTPDGGPLDAARAQIAQQIADWLPLSNLTLNLPASLGELLADHIRLKLRDRHGNRREWRPVADLGFTGPQDDAFVVDRDRSQLLFGNGNTGRVPAPADDFELRLSVGGGSEGNLPAGQAWEIISHPAWPLANLALRNVVLARDGSEPESLPDARDRVAGSLARSERIVTERDIVELVQTMNGIEPQRAHVVLGHDPRFPCAYVPDAITVFIVPRLDRGDIVAGFTDRIDIPTPRPDPGVLALLRERLDRARLVGVRIFVALPRFRAVRLAVALASDTADRAKLLARIRGTLARFLDAVVGGHEQDGWPYGHPLRPSELVRVAQDAVGNEGTVETVGVGLDGTTPDEACTDVEIGPHELVYLDRLELRFKPGLAAMGGVL